MAKIIGVEKDSVCDELGIRAGDELLAIDGKPPEDILDYYYYDGEEQMVMTVRSDGEIIDYEIEKYPYEQLGLELDSTLDLEPIRCKNKCKFCFVDQLPEGMRDTLYVKDDDYRLSFISGNYITLTNCGEKQLKRIVELRMSPLYVSVHATDPEIKTFLVANPEGGKMYSKLKYLTDNGIALHAQIVLCPEINDGEILEKTLNDLYALGENMRTVACVPVGLTGHRDGLYPIKSVDKAKAREVISCIERFNIKAGGNFVWASDEFYIKAELPLPKYSDYGDFEQIENGVGLVRTFERELDDALNECETMRKSGDISFVTGVSFAWFLESKKDRIREKFPNLNISVCMVENEFFGRSITVSGLITAGDIIGQYEGRLARNIVIPSNMLREFTDTFLDGITVGELEKRLGVKAHISAGGGDLVEILKKVCGGYDE